MLLAVGYSVCAVAWFAYLMALSEARRLLREASTPVRVLMLSRDAAAAVAWPISLLGELIALLVDDTAPEQP